ncbi:hypothetical protein [Nocardia niwae]|uniref:Uncharacterized protein n=1 Tax=Nocardia niwae TaxID=626084 RepID=A0ABV2X709_9NOCA
MLLRLGEPPSPVPEPVADIVLAWIDNRTNMNTARPTAARAGRFPADALDNRCAPTRSAI